MLQTNPWESLWKHQSEANHLSPSNLKKSLQWKKSDIPREYPSPPLKGDLYHYYIALSSFSRNWDETETPRGYGAKERLAYVNFLYIYIYNIEKSQVFFLLEILF